MPYLKCVKSKPTQYIPKHYQKLEREKKEEEEDELDKTKINKNDDFKKSTRQHYKHLHGNERYERKIKRPFYISSLLTF